MIRLLLAVGISLTVSLLGTRSLITWLTNHRIGQPIQDDTPDSHQKKAGTPTMGGIAMVGAAFIGYALSDLYNGVYTRTGLIVMATIMGAAVVGMLDDWIKVSRERNLGLSKRAKSIGQLTVAISFAIAMVTLTDVHTELSFTRFDGIGLDLGTVGWCIWAVLLIVGSSNAVNLTDGLDGLAAGASLFAYSAYVVIAFWLFRHDIYDVDHALDLAVVAGAMLGGIVGFLWWNSHPAEIIMGDTGSLALGTGLAALSLATNTHLLLPIIGALFVGETMSVIIQVYSFQRRGKRVFRMAPIHHHFELAGWPEPKVIIRFWIVSGMLTALGVGIFYADYLLLTDQGGL